MLPWRSVRLSPILEEEKASLVPDNDYPSSRGASGKIASAIGPIIFWQILAGFFAMTSLALFYSIPIEPRCGLSEGYATDLKPARSILSTHIIAFDGGPSFDENGEEFLRPVAGKVYVGQPNQEIDDNWTELTKDRWFRLTEDEAREAWGEEYEEFWDEFAGGYLATIDSMHMIHCLDHIRKSFYPEIYGHEEKGLHGVMHRDHCIDAFRQMLMCNADITPLPTRWYPKSLNGRGNHYIDSDRPHTCRNWTAVRDWVSSRSIGQDAVQPHHSPNHLDDWINF